MIKEETSRSQPILFGKNKKTIFLLSAFILALSLLSMLLTIPRFSNTEIIFLNYGISYDILIKSVLSATISTIAFYGGLFFIPATKPASKIETRNILWSLGLFFCGIAAEVVINLIFIYSLKIPALLMMPISTFIILIYSYFCYELCWQDHFADSSRFFEIFRFSLVGAIAAIFDFGVTNLMRYVVLVNLPEIWISVLAVASGFIVGVIINYLCSITMVFTKTSEKDISRTFKGIILFVILGGAGLGIGIGLEILFFNTLGFSEPISFIIRTVVVMIWNYISRKIFIFR